MRTRRALLVAIAALASSASFAADPVRIRRVGVLMITRKGDGPMVTVLEARLQKSGFKAGSNLTIDVESVEFEARRAPQLARALLERGADILYVVAEPMLEAARAHAGKIPIVFINVTDPVERGYIQALAHPGGNITGVTDRYVETGIKRLGLLREVAPNARKVAFVAHYIDMLGFDAWRAAARSLGFDVIDVDLAKGEPLEVLLGKALQQGAACFYPIGSLRSLEREEKESAVVRFQRFAMRHRVPVVYANTGIVKEQGGLVALEVDHGEVLRQGADLVARVLGGEHPSRIAIQQPGRYSIAVNLATAKAIGVTIPQSLLLRADTVIPER